MRASGVLICMPRPAQSLPCSRRFRIPSGAAFSIASATASCRAGALARKFPVSRPAVSRHVRVLRDAGLVRLRRERQTLRYSLNPQPLAEIDRWLIGYRLFWGARLPDLRKSVEENQK